MSIYGQAEDGLTAPAQSGSKARAIRDNLTDEQKKAGAVVVGLLILILVLYSVGSNSNPDNPGTGSVDLGDTQASMDCQWTLGDGVGEGGSEEYLGDTETRKDCVNLVIQTATGANGATYSQTAGPCTDERGCKRCYAEYALSASNGNTDWQTCTLAGHIAYTPVPPDWTVMGCDWVTGDGVGGEERELQGEFRDMAHCVEEVKRAYPSANGATANLVASTSAAIRGSQSSEYNCYAEFGMTAHDASATNWKTCMFIPSYCTYRLLDTPHAGDAEDGDGIGGSEEYVGMATSAGECVNMVLERHPGANGATFMSTGGADCYAEFGMTGADATATNWRTCRFPEAAKVCDFEIGDGVGRGGAGGSETYVGEVANPWSCYHQVREQYPGANGATFSGQCIPGAPDGESANGGIRTCHECYAEFGMEEANGDPAWTTCKMEAQNLHTTNHNPGLGR